MPLVSWSDELSVGIEEIDEQHRQFINIMNELHSAMKSGKARDTLPAIFQKLSSYAQFHFSHEETVMQSYRFPESSSHKMFHDKFTRDTQKLLDDYTNQRILLSIDIMESLKDWLVAHIMGHDKKFGEYMKKIKK